MFTLWILCHAWVHLVGGVFNRFREEVGVVLIIPILTLGDPVARVKVIEIVLTSVGILSGPVNGGYQAKRRRHRDLEQVTVARELT